MTDLIELVYVSRATTEEAGNYAGSVTPVVSRILRQSRKNNRTAGLVGALYFGNGYFLQCLQGSQAAVDKLYAKLKTDPRHIDLKTLSVSPITELTFKEWDMKLANNEQAITKFLQVRHLGEFNPYKFDPTTVTEFLTLLRKIQDAGLPEDTQTSEVQYIKTTGVHAFRTVDLIIILLLLINLGLPYFK